MDLITSLSLQLSKSYAKNSNSIWLVCIQLSPQKIDTEYEALLVL